MNQSKTTRKTERGQSLIEFAFGAVILLILVAGIFDLGRAFFHYIALRDAAQEGAVFASTHADAAINTIRERTVTASDMVSGMDHEGSLTVTVVFSGPACAGVTNAVTVTVTYQYITVMPFFGGQALPLSATVTDTILAPGC